MGKLAVMRQWGRPGLPRGCPLALIFHPARLREARLLEDFRLGEGQRVYWRAAEAGQARQGTLNPGRGVMCIAPNPTCGVTPPRRGMPSRVPRAGFLEGSESLSWELPDLVFPWPAPPAESQLLYG